MSAWKRLYEYARTLSEGRQFHGKSAIRLKDIEKLFMGDGTERDPGMTGFPPDPNGGSVKVNYQFNSSIWKPWYPDMGSALAVASTQDKRDIQTGNAQGGTVHKTNWGGKVANVPAPIRPHANDRLGSTMDRYDVLMVAELGERTNAKGVIVPTAVLTRFCWSPSIGSSDEREARLQALVAGKTPPPLSRRVQGDVPSTSKDDEERWRQQDIARSKATSADSGGEKATGDRGGFTSNSGWKDRLAKHDKEYQPIGQARPKQRVPDPEDALFWTPDKKKG